MPEQEKRNEYLQERMFLVRAEMESYKSFDHSLLLVTTGALVLSVTFITSQDVTTNFEIALVAWVLWVASTIFQLVSKIWSAKALAEQQAIIEEVYRDDTKEFRENKYNKTVHRLNSSAVMCFATGTAMFLLFIYKVLNF